MSVCPMDMINEEYNIIVAEMVAFDILSNPQVLLIRIVDPL